MLVETRLGLYAPPGEAHRQEALGYAGTFTRETNGDPFLPLAVAASETRHIELGTAVAIAFARSPMTTAYAAHRLQGLTSGRFVLGLGTQVRAHVQRRFSMPWDQPVARMGEYVTALRAIWSSWRTGERLAHRGRFYTHTLMTPAFTPQPHGHPDPLLLLAGVGPQMTRLACDVADGLVVHPFTGSDYLREVTRPAVNTARGGRGGFRVSGAVLVATGRDDNEMSASVEALRAQVAFYGSTPAYRPILAHHGWADLADRLHALSVSSSKTRWGDMARLVPDDVVRAIGVVAPPEELAAAVAQRYDGLLDRICLTSPAPEASDLLDAAAHTLNGRAYDV